MIMRRIVLYSQNYAGTTTNFQIVLNTQKIPTKIKPHKILANFSYPKTISESKISNPQKLFDDPRHLKSGVPHSPTPWELD